MGQRVVTNADESLEMPGPGGDATGQIFSHPYGKAENLVHNLSPTSSGEDIFPNPTPAPGFDLPRCCCRVQTARNSDLFKTKCEHTAEIPTVTCPDLLTTTSTTLMALQEKNPKQNPNLAAFIYFSWFFVLFCLKKSKIAEVGDGKPGSDPPILNLETSRRQKQQWAGCVWASLPPSILAPLCLGEGERGKLLILGRISSGFWLWRGSLLKGDIAAGPFHASLSQEFTVTPSRAMPGASSRSRLQGLILPFGVMK